MKIEEGNKQLVKVCPLFTIYLLEQKSILPASPVALLIKYMSLLP